MSQRRTVILIAAVVIGVLAAGALFLYVNDIEDRERAEIQQVDVFRVSQDIPRGTPFEVARASIEATTVPAELRPATAVNSLDVLIGQVARADIAQGQMLVGNMFAPPSEVPSVLKERIQNETDHVAVSISVDQVRAVAGLIQPGDLVNMLVTFNPRGQQSVDSEGNPIEGAAADTGQFTAHFFQEVRIIAIGQTVQPGAGDEATGNQAQIGSGVLTLELPPENAARIVHLLATGGTPYLTLLTDSYEPRPVQVINDANLIPGPNQLTPYPDRNQELQSANP